MLSLKFIVLSLKYESVKNYLSGGFASINNTGTIFKFCNLTYKYFTKNF